MDKEAMINDIKEKFSTFDDNFEISCNGAIINEGLNDFIRRIVAIAECHDLEIRYSKIGDNTIKVELVQPIKYLDFDIKIIPEENNE